MRLTRSERLILLGAMAAAVLAPPRGLRALSIEVPLPAGGGAGVLAQALPQAPSAPQAPAGAVAPAPPASGGGRSIVTSDINVSRTEAVLRLGLSDGRTVEYAIRDGRMFADGTDLGAAPRGSAGERAWRAFLTQAMDVSAPEVAGLVRRWSPPAPDGALKNAMIAALAGTPEPPLAAAPPPAALGPNTDTLAKLESRLEQMQQRLEEMQERRAQAQEDDNGAGWRSPLRYVVRGLTGIMATLVMFAILFAIGLATVLLGGRPRLEAVADTARRQTTRSWVVGLAGSFLVLPAFVVGILALTISIVGIPALLVFVPLFPVAVILAAIFGYLGVAHAAGEALAERRLYGGDWFRRGNSYYFLLTGLGLLMGLFLAAHVVEMAGPWLGFIRGLLTFVAVVITWFAFTTGFGAVLLTRGGSRPTSSLGPLESDLGSTFEEESRV